jgi:hypothetical protein
MGGRWGKDGVLVRRWEWGHLEGRVSDLWLKSMRMIAKRGKRDMQRWCRFPIAAFRVACGEGLEGGLVDRCCDVGECLL